MGVYVSLQKGKENICLGRVGFVFHDRHDVKTTADIDDMVADILEQMHSAEACIKAAVAYSPKSNQELTEMLEDVDESLEYLGELSGKLRLAYTIRDLIDDGYKIIIE